MESAKIQEQAKEGLKHVTSQSQVVKLGSNGPEKGVQVGPKTSDDPRRP